MLVVCCFIFVVCSSSCFVGCFLLAGGCCLLRSVVFDVCCSLLSLVCCVLFVISCFLFVDC